MAGLIDETGEGTCYTSITTAGEDSWLALRREGIGGSDVAGIMGLSPWATPLDIWLSKRGPSGGSPGRMADPSGLVRDAANDDAPSPYIQFGHDYEPTIRAHFAAAHPEMLVEGPSATLLSIKRPWAIANLDGSIYSEREGWGILECKTARDASGWRDGVPVYYQTQVYHYMSVTGRRYAYVCVFWRDSCEYGTYRLDWDDETTAAIDKAVDTFWREFVLAGVMPAVTHRDTGALAELYGKPGDDYITGDSDTNDLLADYIKWQRAEKDAREKKQAAQAKIERAIGDARGIDNEYYRCTWVRGPAHTIDIKRLRADHPEIAEQYTRESHRNGGLKVRER